MYELTLRTVNAVIEDAKENILSIVDGWTLKDCIGMWKGTEEASVEFTTVSDSLEDVQAVLDAVYSAQLGEESVMKLML